MQISFSPHSLALNTSCYKAQVKPMKQCDLEHYICLPEFLFCSKPNATPAHFPWCTKLVHTQQVRWHMQDYFFRGYSKIWGSKIISIIGLIKPLQLIESLAEINSSIIDTSSLGISFYFCFLLFFFPFLILEHNLTSTSHNTELKDVQSLFKLPVTDVMVTSGHQVTLSFKAEKSLRPLLMPW